MYVYIQNKTKQNNKTELNAIIIWKNESIDTICTPKDGINFYHRGYWFPKKNVTLKIFLYSVIFCMQSNKMRTPL